jgi:glucokinase
MGLPTERTPPVLAIDIGASSVKAALVDTGAWRLSHRMRSVDIADRTFAELRAAVEAIAHDALAAEPSVTRVGISTTGSANADDMVISSGFYAGYANVNWLDILQARTAGRIRVATVLNDGRAAALGTYLADARAARKNLVHFVVGTGIGGGMVWDGELFNGAHNFAGAYGHIRVDPGSEIGCVCGGRGCVEVFAAAPALAREAAARGIRLTTPDGRGVRELGQLAQSGSAAARAVFEAGGRYLGAAVAAVANVCDPEIITIGGGVVAAARDPSGANPYVNSAAAAARTMVIPRIADHLRVVEASLLNDAALLGAAARAATRAGVDGPRTET